MKAENITYTKGTRLIPPDKLIKIIPNKENHKATFCFSTIISTHSGLPAALISLFFGFSEIVINCFILLKFGIIILLVTISSKCNIDFYLLLVCGSYIWLQLQNLSLDFNHQIFTSCF